MTKFGWVGLLTVLATALGIALLLQHRGRSQLAEENRQLRQRVGQLSQLSLETTRLSNLVAHGRGLQTRLNDQLRELMRLRSEVNELRRQTNELKGRAAEPLALAPKPAPAESEEAEPTRIARESWAFAGYGSPEAALQTIAWAMSNGDVQTYLASLTPEGFQFVEQQSEGKTEAEMAAMLKEEISAARSLRLDRKRNSGDGKVAFVIAASEQDDGETKVKDEQLAVFKNVAGEWRLTAAPDE